MARGLSPQTPRPADQTLSWHRISPLDQNLPLLRPRGRSVSTQVLAEAWATARGLLTSLAQAVVPLQGSPHGQWSPGAVMSRGLAAA